MNSVSSMTKILCLVLVPLLLAGGALTAQNPPAQPAAAQPTGELPPAAAPPSAPIQRSASAVRAPRAYASAMLRYARIPRFGSVI